MILQVSKCTWLSDNRVLFVVVYEGCHRYYRDETELPQTVRRFMQSADVKTHYLSDSILRSYLPKKDK